jgi:hypothetical protein
VATGERLSSQVQADCNIQIYVTAEVINHFQLAENLVGIKIIPLVGIQNWFLLSYGGEGAFTMIKLWISSKTCICNRTDDKYIAKELEHELEECYNIYSLLRR